MKTLIALLLSLSAFAHVHDNEIPSRLQWRNNLGYCGEMSLINAGLYYGQYISQYDVRALITKDHSQVHGELLIGVNDTHAATSLHLNYEEWDATLEQNTNQFLVWLKQKIVQGYPVAIGLYANQYLFYGNTDPNSGDPDYDHIVTATKLTSSHSINDPTYYGDDEIAFSDHGLWHNGNAPVYYFSYACDPFQANRMEANAVDGPIYSLANDGSNYGIAITGIVDLKGETVPVRIETDYNYENPPIKEGSNNRPEPMPITLTITISDLEPNVPYILYRYNKLQTVPNSNFNSHPAYKSWRIQISTGSTYTKIEKIKSDEIAVYRCVKATL